MAVDGEIAASSVVRFGVLGRLTAENDEGELPIPGTLPRVLLAHLLANANRDVSADHLVEALWGATPPTSADVGLRGHVQRLRGFLGDDDRSLIHTTVVGYRIQVSEGCLDLETFTRSCTLGRHAAQEGRWEQAFEILTDAMTLWRGDPLADIPAHISLAGWIEQIRETRIAAVEARIEAGLRLGLHEQLIAELRALVAEHPMRERMHAFLMTALAGTGCQAEALAAYQNARKVLVSELGVEPGPELRLVQERVLSGDAGLLDPAVAPQTAEPVRPLPPRGETSTVLVTTEQLPADIMDFTGRQAAVAELVRLAGVESAPAGTAAPGSPAAPGSDDSPVRPVVISAVTGTGGVGKTTLAVHVGHKLRAAHPDGQLYVNLAGVGESPRDPSEVLATLLRDLGQPDEAVPPDQEGRAARFRTLTSRLRLLIVLDDARDAAQVRPLLPGSGRCTVLVTSRRRLAGLAGAVPMHLDVLEPAEALELFTSLVGAARVAAEPGAVEQVLAYCGGLPLAVRIAAARLASRPTWTVAALAVRLSDEHRRLDELRVEDVAVRTTFQMSYRSLAEHEDDGCGSPARAFRLVGLIPGPDFAVDAAAALLDLPAHRVEDLLEGLVDVNLLEAVSPGRYRLHDLLRDFARELAAQACGAAECSQTLTGLIRWYAHTTSAAVDHLSPRRVAWGLEQVPAPSAATGFADRSSAWQWLLTERINIAAAVTAAEQQLPGPEAWVLAAQTLTFYEHRSLWSELHDTHVAGLRCARRLDDVLGCSRMLTGIAHALTRMQSHDAALDASGEAVTTAEQAGDIRLVAAARVNHAGSLSNVGHREESAAMFRTSLAVMREIGEPQPLAATLINFGNLLSHTLHQYAEADVCFEEAVQLAHAAGSPFTAAYALSGMAESRRLQGETHSQIELLTEAAAICDSIGDRGSLAENLVRLVDALVLVGRMDEARSEWVKATELLREIGDVDITELRRRLDKQHSAAPPR